MRFSLIAAAMLALAPVVSNAADLTGGSVELGYSNITNANYGYTPESKSVSGSAEIGFGNGFAVQGDLGYTDFGRDFSYGKTIALHAIYHPTKTTAFGAFYGRLYAGDEGINYYGLEAGFGVNRFWGEGYFSHAELPSYAPYNFNLDMYGVSGRYALNDRIELKAAFDGLDVFYMKSHHVGLGIDYRLNDHFALTGNVGRVYVDGNGSTDYVGIGAKFTFGPNKRATFRQRSLLDYGFGFAGFGAG